MTLVSFTPRLHHAYPSPRIPLTCRRPAGDPGVHTRAASREPARAAVHVLLQGRHARCAPLYKLNSRTHVPQKLSGLISHHFSPASILNVPVQTVHKAPNHLNRLMAGFVWWWYIGCRNPLINLREHIMSCAIDDQQRQQGVTAYFAEGMSTCPARRYHQLPSG